MRYEMTVYRATFPRAKYAAMPREATSEPRGSVTLEVPGDFPRIPEDFSGNTAMQLLNSPGNWRVEPRSGGDQWELPAVSSYHCLGEATRKVIDAFRSRRTEITVVSVDC